MTPWTPASMGDPACTDGCPPATARPYARGKLPSVTTLIGTMDKPGLPWGAASETAKFAVLHQDEWKTMDPTDAIDKLRKHHRGVWDASARVGTLVHQCAEAWSKHQLWDVPSGTPDDEADRLGGYIDGLAAFWQDCQPEVIATEIVVREPDLYVGTFDWLGYLTVHGERHVWGDDFKTTANLDPDKGFYTESWRPQLAAYRHAAEVVHYHGGTEVACWKFEDCFPRPERTGILHLRGNGGYQLIEVAADEAALEMMAVLRKVRDWNLKGGHGTPASVVVAERKAS